MFEDVEIEIEMLDPSGDYYYIDAVAVIDHYDPGEPGYSPRHDAKTGNLVDPGEPPSGGELSFHVAVDGAMRPELDEVVLNNAALLRCIEESCEEDIRINEEKCYWVARGIDPED